MKRAPQFPALLWFVLAGILAATIAAPAALAQDDGRAKAPAAKAKKTAKAAEMEPVDPAAEEAPPKKLKGRLPNYYGQIVDDAQRQQILAILEEYDAKIRPLKDRVELLTKQRNAKVEAVLTPEQRKRVEDLKAAAKAKREAKAGKKNVAATK